MFTDKTRRERLIEGADKMAKCGCKPKIGETCPNCGYSPSRDGGGLVTESRSAKQDMVDTAIQQKMSGLDVKVL